MAMRAGGLGLGGMVVLALLSWATGTDLFSIVGDQAPTSYETGPTGPPADTTPAEERLVDMVDAVAADTQATWTELMKGRYQQTRVVLFREGTQTGCGVADASTGPFYCPADHLVYLDLSFFQELTRRFGAPGEFAQAYVVAHEFGHHVQNLLGTDERARGDRSGANSASVALELQADCYAGVWGHAASDGGRMKAGRVQLESGDMEAALRAAAAIGDDRIQKMSGRRVSPESFTHGSSAQRMEWFKRGMDTGDPNQCNTFAALTH
jgi:predicted metalloprotease